MTKRSEYQGTSCQNHIQEKNVRGKKSFTLAYIFVNPQLVILANCCACWFGLGWTCAALCVPQILVPWFAPLLLESGSDGRHSPVLRSWCLHLTQLWSYWNMVLCACSSWSHASGACGTAFSAVPCAACLHPHSSQVCSSSVLFLRCCRASF